MMSDPHDEVPTEPPTDSDPFSALFGMAQRQRESAIAAYREIASAPEYPDLLTDALRTLDVQYQPEVGELVQWRKYMQNRYLPAAGKPAIDLEVLATPREVDTEGRPLAFPHDVRVGYIDGDASLSTFLTSSRRLMKWTDSASAPEREGSSQQPTGTTSADSDTHEHE